MPVGGWASAKSAAGSWSRRNTACSPNSTPCRGQVISRRSRTRIRTSKRCTRRRGPERMPATLIEPTTFTDDEKLIGGEQNLVTVGEKIGNVCLGEIATPKGWWMCFLFGFTLLQGLLIAVTYLFYMGLGIWGINSPIFWGLAILNFVWWIGIGHAGTLISAILLLMHQKWRTSLNRFAEAMTIFAVMCAGMFPLIHMGRPWVFYWLLPFPNN